MWAIHSDGRSFEYVDTGNDGLRAFVWSIGDGWAWEVMNRGDYYRGVESTSEDAIRAAWMSW